MRVNSVLGCVLAAAVAGQAMASEGDPAVGEAVYQSRCQVCHSVDPDAGHRGGPNLFGVYDRAAGEMEGFRFSSAHRESGLVWDEATLDRYLANYGAVVPRTPKYIPGVRSDRERADLIAYLKTVR